MKPGFYWVKQLDNGGWEVAEYDGAAWSIGPNIAIVGSRIEEPVCSEDMLDTIRLIWHAEDVWGSRSNALAWLQQSVAALSDQRPIDLLATVDERKWISDVLNKIDQGDFS